jgi:hypothetical protein
VSTSNFEASDDARPFWQRLFPASWFSAKAKNGEIGAGFWATFYDRIEPPDPTEWHHWNLLLMARSIDGHWVSRYVWRRFHEGKWEYRPRETEHDRIPGDW